LSVPIAERPVDAVVLAAGKGTRMRSALPKVMHEAAGRPLLSWVLDAARGAGCRRVLAVVGHGGDQVAAALEAEDVTWVEQAEQLGTGHALAQVRDRLEGAALLVVLSGDVPLVRPATLERLVERARAGWGAMAVADLEEPGSLGRVLLSPDGTVERIVEAADATLEQRAIRTVNAGIYALPAPEVFEFIDRLGSDNAQGEIYLTDAVGEAASSGLAMRPVVLADPSEALGVNTRSDLARVRRALLDRRAAELAAAGVTVWEPERTTIEPAVEIGPGSEIHGGVTLLGRTRVGADCTILPGAWIKDSVLADGVIVKPYSVLEGAEVGPRCEIGPFARLRPGTVLVGDGRVGNFVEVKNSRLESGVKAGHLSYLGDAAVGEGTNIGAGTITCNYDGYSKHRTEIGRQASIGSDTMLVAPVKVGDRAVTGAGSVISADVPDDALAVERSRQRNIANWAKKSRRRKGD